MSTHIYKIKKGEIELETTDKDLALRILGFWEQQFRAPKLQRPQPVKVSIKETERSYCFGKGGSVSKACVEEVFNAIAESHKPYILKEELRPLEKKYSAAYVGRALKLLKLKGMVQSFRIGIKAGYRSTISKRDVVSPLKVLDQESQALVERASEEAKIQEKAIREGLK
ncbi:MAG: hypothetical protein K6T73_07770 [Candidatus Bathyarchaeota archaeon]|nr:hypothetical protein [Candidatus Bathyarchaeota archaeon]